MGKANPRELKNAVIKVIESMVRAREARDRARAISGGGQTEQVMTLMFDAFRRFFAAGEKVKEVISKVRASGVRCVDTGARRFSVPELRLIGAEAVKHAALAAEFLGDLESAVQCLRIAANLVDSHTFDGARETASLLGSIHNNYGWMLLRRGDPAELPEARRRLLSAIDCYTRAGQPYKRTHAEANLKKLEAVGRGESVDLELPGFRTVPGTDASVTLGYADAPPGVMRMGDRLAVAQWAPDGAWVIINGTKFDVGKG